MTEEKNRFTENSEPKEAPAAGGPKDTQEQDEYAQLIRKLKQQVGENQPSEEEAPGDQPPQAFEMEEASDPETRSPEMEHAADKEVQAFQPEPQINISLEQEEPAAQQESGQQEQQKDEPIKSRVDLQKEAQPFDETPPDRIQPGSYQEPQDEGRQNSYQPYQNEQPSSEAASGQPHPPYETRQHDYSQGGSGQPGRAGQWRSESPQGAQNAQSRQEPKSSAKPNDRIFQLRYRMSMLDWDRINDRERKHMRSYKMIQILGYVLGGLVLLFTFIAGISDAVNSYEYYSYGYTISVNFDAFGVLLGLLLVLFPVFLRSSMKKNVKRSYMATPSFRSDMTLNFYEGYVEQISVSSKTAYRWGYIDSFQETAEAFIIYTLRGPQNQGIFIPKSSLTPQDMMMLDRLFSYLSGKYQKIYLKNFL